MAVVTFDYTAWALQFANIAAQVGPDLAQIYFDRRCPQFLDNTDCSPVTDVNVRAGLLDLLVAHIASVSGQFGASGQGIVGRISQATEGSVTIASEYPVNGAIEAWFSQTPYGAQFWVATSPYRHGGIYVPGAQPIFDEPLYGPGGVTGWGLGVTQWRQ